MRVFWDTNLFIYLTEDFGTLTAQTLQLHKRMRDRGDQLVTSVMTLGEMLVRGGLPGPAAAETIESLLREAAVLSPFDDSAARHYGVIRRDREIRPPDAIQLACAVREGSNLFVTNDARLSRKVVPGGLILSSLASVPI